LRHAARDATTRRTQSLDLVKGRWKWRCEELRGRFITKRIGE
jgi:hypothetical protein